MVSDDMNSDTAYMALLKELGWEVSEEKKLEFKAMNIVLERLKKDNLEPSISFDRAHSRLRLDVECFGGHIRFAPYDVTEEEKVREERDWSMLDAVLKELKASD